jgi:signal transduction histidine kinase
MPNDSLNPPLAGRNFSARIIAALVRPAPFGVASSIAIVVMLTVLNGWLYYITNGVISLQLFYLVPLILAVSWLGLGGGVLIAVLSALARILGDMGHAGDSFFTAANLVRVGSNRFNGILLHLLIALIIHELILLSRQLEQRVQTRSAALRQAVEAREKLQNSLFEVSRRERSAIGRDLHDGLGQHLTATAMAANILSRRLTTRNDPLAGDARTVESFIKTAIDQTRQMGRGLLLDTIPPDEFVSELEELAAGVTHEQNMPCALTTEGAADRLDITTTSHLFYIAREAVRNAVRHGGASRVAIHLAVSRAVVGLTITDNGRGLDQKPSDGKGMGLRIMAHRAELINGRLEIGGAPGGGTRVDCQVPLLVAA